MNYTINDLNRFIETEKRKDVLPREYFQIVLREINKSESKEDEYEE